jgi:hypothetical protein
MTKNPITKLRLSSALALSLLATGGALAHEGHGEPAAATSSAPAAAAARPATAPAAVAAPAGSPRFAAVSPDFELVGVLEGRKLTLWLDRAATNAPVTAGALELEVGDAKLQPQPQGDAWVATLPADPAPGTLAVTASVSADGTTDLLAGELVLPAPAAGPTPTSWLQGRNLSIAGGALLAATLLAAAAWSRTRRRRTA